MNNLKKILLAGSLLLTPASCGKNPKILTEEDFTKADWVSVPYEGEIWTSYAGEDVPRYNKNWELYQKKVAEKNNFTYAKKDSLMYIIGFKGKTILVPDLDKDGFVKFKRRYVDYNITDSTEVREGMK